MKKIMIYILVMVFSFTLSASKIGKDLQRYLDTTKNIDSLRVWIFLTDKGFRDNSEYNELIAKAWDSMTEKKRERLRNLGKYATFDDIPVYDEYVKKLSEYGHIREISKILNAVSMDILYNNLKSIEELPFVSEIEKVHIFKIIPDIVKTNLSKSLIDSTDYGYSYMQNHIVGIDKLHNVGITGQGVIIGIMDTGFDLQHIAVENVNVIWSHDFVNDDDYVGYNPAEDSSRDMLEHGTAMLALAGAYKPVSEGFISQGMIGGAFNAQFALARTEILEEERTIEEDNWVAAFESFDSLGVDIISSSLAYRWFYDDTTGYSYSEMDGRTAVTSHIASTAASRGILLVNAIGNRPLDAECDIDTMIPAPADAYDILAVGGCDLSKFWWSTSLKGPTADGRQRPQVIAPAEGIWVPHASYDDSSYAFVSGTSAATAIVASGAALIKSAHPDWSPEKIMDVIFNTCQPPVIGFDDITGDTLYQWDPDTIINPLDTVGYGIPDFYKAVFSESVDVDTFSQGALGDVYPMPFYPNKNQYVCIPFSLSRPSKVEVKIFSSSGKLVKTIEMPEEAGEFLPVGKYDSNDINNPYHGCLWDGTNDDGYPVSSGIYYVVWTNHFETYKTKVVVIR